MEKRLTFVRIFLCLATGDRTTTMLPGSACSVHLAPTKMSASSLLARAAGLGSTPLRGNQDHPILAWSVLLAIFPTRKPLQCALHASLELTTLKMQQPLVKNVQLARIRCKELQSPIPHASFAHLEHFLLKMHLPSVLHAPQASSRWLGVHLPIQHARHALLANFRPTHLAQSVCHVNLAPFKGQWEALFVSSARLDSFPQSPGHSLPKTVSFAAGGSMQHFQRVAPCALAVGLALTLMSQEQQTIQPAYSASVEPSPAQLPRQRASFVP